MSERFSKQNQQALHYCICTHLFLSRGIPNLNFTRNSLYLQSFGNEKGSHCRGSCFFSIIAFGKSKYQ